MQAIEELEKALVHLENTQNMIFMGRMTARAIVAQFFLEDAVAGARKALLALQQEKEE